MTNKNEYHVESDVSGLFVGLGWDVNDEKQYDFDLDASAFMLTENGRVACANDFIYYKNLKHPTGAVCHTGDNTTGEGEGDDEAITIDFSSMPAYVEKVVFTVSIYEAVDRKQNFGQVKNAYIRLYDEELGELFRYDLDDDFSDSTALIFGELVRSGEGWKFRAVGEGYTGGLVALSLRYGVFRK